MRGHLFASWLLVGALSPTVLGCASHGPQTKASSPPVAKATPGAAIAHEAASEPQSALVTGELTPIDHADVVVGHVVGRHVEGEIETVAVEVVLPIPAAFNALESAGSVVTLDGEAMAPYAFAALPDDVSVIEGRGVGTAILWLRRHRAAEGQPLLGHLYTPQLGSEPGHHLRFRAELATPPPPSERKVLTRWATAFALHLRALGDAPWNRFAAARILEVFADRKDRASAPAAQPPLRDTLTSLMETTTGMVALQETLQQDRPLLLLASKEPQTLPVAKLAPPKSPAHPWAQMQRTLGAGPSEPLASAVPAAFWYVRASDVGTFFRLTDELDHVVTPALRVAEADPLDRGLVDRYATELGMARTALGRALGPQVVTNLALVGSDPYLREGSDLTALFRLRQPALFEAFLEASLASHDALHGALTRETLSYEGVAVTGVRSRDGAVHQWRAKVGDLAVVSNSQTACKRVLDAIGGRLPRLADEPDFRYLLARDGEPGAGAFAFMGDRFVGEVTGPRQKVLEARRQLAAAELMTPGFASLLYGFVYGRSPASVDELRSSRLLGKQDLAHLTGGAITWQPGQGARSVWGTPSAFTPLIDLPSPERVSASERVAYDRFARSYESYWSSYIDPAALRIALAAPSPSSSSSQSPSSIAGPAAAAPSELSALLRVLPLIDGSEYRELRELAGQAHVVAPPLAKGGLRAVVGIGQSAGLRRELGQLAGGIGGRHGLTVDFLGDWAMAGVVDRPRLTSMAKNLIPDLPEPPTSERPHVDEVAELARAPVYAAVGIRSVAGAAIAISALRLTAKDALGDLVTWGELDRQHDVPVVRISVRPQGGAESAHDVSIYYALMTDVLLVALDESILRTLIDEAATGKGPQPEAAKEVGAQLVVDLSAAPEGGLLTVAGWLLANELNRSSERGRVQALSLLRGAPEPGTDLRALGIAYLGGVPVPAHGGAYTLAAAGVQDPYAGSAHAPRWPKLPVPGSAVEQLVRTLGSLRSEVRLDEEGRDPRNGQPMQSLRVKTSLGTRSAP